MDVFIVLENFDYEGQRVVGVFASRDEAQAYIDSNPRNIFGNTLYGPEIEHWVDTVEK